MMQDLYNTNKDFREYVDKYCRTYHCTVEDALKHFVVQLVAEQYRDLDHD